MASAPEAPLLRTDDLVNPFKGQESYEVEDAQLFFGRDREADELTAAILAHPVTILNAGSGVGKTSLLNARIIPRLEAYEWVPVRVRPGDHPTESVRSSVLRYLLPPPEAEAFAIRAAAQELAVGLDEQFGKLAAGYDARQAHGTTPFDLIRPVLNALEYVPPEDGTAVERRLAAFTSANDLLSPFPSAVPYVCRVLRQSMEISRAGIQIATVMRGVDVMPAPNRSGVEGTLEWLANGGLERVPLNQLLEALESDQARSAYRSLLARLYLPLPGLLPFFDNLFSLYAALRSRLGVVLILDQFEEIFTRFAGPVMSAPGAAVSRREVQPKLPAYLRDQFFNDFGVLYRGTGGARDHALRFVFSLREEYTSRLAVILRRAAVPDADRAIYRLSLLTEEQARAAMRKPLARHYHVDDEVERTTFARLRGDDREFQPGPLQIVCTWLWDHRDESHLRDVRHDGKIVLGTEALFTDGAESINDILERFFRRFLEEAPAKLRQKLGKLFADASDEQLTRYARITILDLLRPLLTADRTRNIVEGAQLVQASFRRGSIRRVILAHLEASRVLRREPRSDGEFYEISHEFLIAPVLKALGTEVELTRLTRALQALEYAWLTEQPELPEPDFETLTAFQELLEVPAPFDEVMFRTAVYRGADKKTLERWYASCARTLTYRDYPEQIDGNAKWPLSRQEAVVLENALPALDPERREVQTKRLAELLLKSWIVSGEPNDREMVQRATRRLGT